MQRQTLHGIRWVMFLVLASFLSFQGCSTSNKTRRLVLPENEASVKRTDRLFPYGIYYQKVSLLIPASGNQSEKKFNFDGIVQLKEESIRVVVLAGIGLTAAKIFENLKNGEVTTDIYLDGMKKYESKIRDYYNMMRLILLATQESESGSQLTPGLKWISRDSQNHPVEVESTGFEKNVRFRFQKFDERGIPEKIAISHSQFQVDLEVTGYEL